MKRKKKKCIGIFRIFFYVKKKMNQERIINYFLDYIFIDTVYRKERWWALNALLGKRLSEYSGSEYIRKYHRLSEAFNVTISNEPITKDISLESKIYHDFKNMVKCENYNWQTIDETINRIKKYYLPMFRSNTKSLVSLIFEFHDEFKRRKTGEDKFYDYIIAFKRKNEEELLRILSTLGGECDSYDLQNHKKEIMNLWKNDNLITHINEIINQEEKEDLNKYEDIKTLFNNLS